MALAVKQWAFAGLWFMAAAVIPTLFFAWLILNTTDHAGNSFIQSPRDALNFGWWFVLVPLLLAGILGSLLAAGILDPNKVRRAWQAVLRGLLVLVITFLLFSVVISLRETSDNDYETFLRMWILTLAFGSIAVGWLVAIVGMIAGWLLYKWR